MPKAVVSIDDRIRKELKTCPGGYVVLKRLSYGQYLKRQEQAMQMRFAGNAQNASGDIEMAQRRVAQYEFQHCIVEHNLENESGQLLDF